MTIPIKGVPEDLPQYIMSEPDPQNAMDIFKGEWSCKLPDEWSHLTAGSTPAFEDVRMNWWLDMLGGVKGEHLLELGPLEAAHTYMLEKAGAKSIISIEANARAYLKCLIIKEVLGLHRTRFLCGNFMEWLGKTEERFDVVFASGVLYHMTEPVELISRVSKLTDRICIWTLYHDPEGNPDATRLSRSVSKVLPAETEKFQHTLYLAEYGQEELEWCGFCGGGRPYRYLLSKEDILRCLDHFGFKRVEIGADLPEGEVGGSFALIAWRET